MHIDIARKIKRLRDLWKKLGAMSDNEIVCYLAEKQIESCTRIENAPKEN
tara:strand:- start:213 stop:362 length:150 start_codon:yes stop_codon:yes gene_type:complete